MRCSKYMKIIGTFLGIGVILVGVSSVNRAGVFSKIQKEDKLATSNQKTEESRAETLWTYEKDENGSLKRKSLKTGEEEKIIDAVEEWCIGENQLLFTTPVDWSLLKNEDETYILNSLVITDLKGETQKAVMDCQATFKDQEEKPFYMVYHPIAVKNKWIYFSIGKGKQGTDAMQQYFYRCHFDGSNLEKLSDTAYYSLQGCQLTDDAIYYADCEMGEGYEAVLRLDLNTKQLTEIEPHGKVLQIEDGTLYYIGFTLQEDNWKATLKALNIDTQEKYTITELGDWQYDDEVYIKEEVVTYHTFRMDEAGNQVESQKQYDLKTGKWQM